MYLGIEIGGTKLQIGIGDGQGAIDALWRGTVVPSDGAVGIRSQIVAAIPEVCASAKRKREDLKGIGVGFGGPVDDATRTVIKSHQIEGWDGFPLADWIEQSLGLPAALGNDADVAGLAEALFGAGKGLSPIFYITIGSGIGGGLIIDGEIYRGAGRGAAEIGHLEVHETPHVLEELASGWGIGASARARIHHGHGHDSEVLRLAGRKVDNVSARHVAQAAAGGDEFAQLVMRDTVTDLAKAIRHVIALLCPRRIVIGGGVSLMGEELLFQPLRQLVAAFVFEPFADCYDIVPAALGEEVVVHGALALARRRSITVCER